MNKMIIMVALLWLSGCATSTYEQRTTAQGAAIGATAGAVIGAQNNRVVEGAVIGGALGALTGAVIAERKVKRNEAKARQTQYYNKHKAAQPVKQRYKKRKHDDDDDDDDDDDHKYRSKHHDD